MTAQELKNAILQLAVQGKLVPQDPNDEPASELLKRIKAKKEHLINDGKIKKDKPLSPITEDETPFEIPDSWEWVRISEISSISSGGTPSRTNSSYWNGSIPLVKIGDISSKYVTSAEESITDAGLNASSAKVFSKGTLLYTIFATIGTVGILNIDAATNQAVAGITFFGDYNIDYLYYILVGLKDIFVAKGKGMAQMNINQTILKSTPIPVPPLNEQKRIVAKIEELLPLVEAYGKAEEKLDQLNTEFPDKLRKSILQQAIQGKLTERNPSDEPASELLKRIRAEKEQLIKEGKIKKEKPLSPITQEEIPFEIPECWAWVRFANVINFMSTGPFGSMLHKSDYISDGVPLVNPANIVDEHINPSKKMMVSNETAKRLSSYRLEKGVIVMGRRGEMGRCAVITDIEDGWLCGTGSFFMKPSSLMCCNYLIKLFSSTYAKKYLGGESVGATMNNLNHAILSKMLVPIPPLAEQQRIVDRVNELLALCDELK
ncbi:MAG: restriction endonuclease subunit S [Clostridia bacterium]|nr:restriction endonuclease subunit S [Clostridia bacterium]